MTPLALVGVQGHGRAHLSAIREIESAGLARLVAVADPAFASGNELSAELATPPLAKFLSLKELLASGVAEAVVLCTPLPLHDQMVRQTLDSRVKRILIEKPAVPFLGQLDALIAADRDRRVRVGFQMLFWPPLRQLKSALADGVLGTVRSVRVAASWPRATAYYGRNRWAGRMSVDGEPVFDGPATNALSHLVHDVAFLLGKSPPGFAEPTRVSGSLARVRPIESYDTALLAVEFGDVRADFFFTHAGDESLPFQIRVVGTRATAVLRQESPCLELPGGSPHTPASLNSSDKGAMYRALCGPEAMFSALPSTLADVRPFTLITNGALHSSNGIDDVPGDRIRGPREWGSLDNLADIFSTFWFDPDATAARLGLLRGRWIASADIPACFAVDPMQVDRSAGIIGSLRSDRQGRAAYDRHRDDNGGKSSPSPGLRRK